MKPVANHEKMGSMFLEDVDEGALSYQGVVANRRQRESVDCSTMVKGNRKDPNAHSYTVLRLDFPNGENTWSWVYRGYYSHRKQSGCIAFDPDHPYLDGVLYPPNLYNRTLSKLNEQVRGSLDLSVGLAQAGQTAKMLNVIEAIRNYTRQPFSLGWRKVIRDVSNARLAFMYGWKPLASDLYGIVDESLRFVINELENYKVRCSDTVESSFKNSKFKFQNFGTPQGVGSRDGKYLCEIKVRLSTAGLDIDRWASLNPLSIAWELVPYSFVVDWIIDVGSYLRDIETSLLYSNSFVNGYVTQCTMFDAQWSCDESYSSVFWGSTNTYSVRATSSFLYRDLTRTLLSSYPVPLLPHFEADLGAGRLLNLAALLGSKLAKTSPR